MRQGQIPSVADAAEAAEVSRATAYRYFPSQAALIQAAIDELMAHVPTGFDEQEPVARVQAMARRVVGLTAQEEPLLRAALRVGLDQWAQRQADEDGAELIVRGGRRASIAGALEGVSEHLDKTARARLEAALTVVVGIEARVVLSDICGLTERQIGDVVEWAAGALARAALEETD